MLSAAQTEKIATRYINPHLADLHGDVVARWQRRYPTMDLASDMLENPRLADRITREIAGDPLDITQDELTATEIFQPMSALMLLGADRVAQAVGIAWHRQSVLDWITWNTLTQKAPGVSLQEARLALDAVSDKTRRASGAPQQVDPDLTFQTVVSTGQRLIGMWRVQQPVKIVVRLDLFAPTTPQKPQPHAAEFVQDVTTALLAHHGEEPANDS